MERNRRCFICRGLIPTEAVHPGIDEGLLFKFLCSFFGLPFSSQALNLPVLSDSEFCDDCKKILIKALEIKEQLTKLEVQACKIRCHLQRCITCNYSNTDEVVSEANNAFVSIGKFFVQCWSDCKVVIPQLDVTQLSEYPTTIKTEAETDFSEQLFDDYGDYSTMEDPSLNMNTEVADKDELVCAEYESYLPPNAMSQNTSIRNTKIPSEAVVKRKRGRPKRGTAAIAVTCRLPITAQGRLIGQEVASFDAEKAEELVPRRRGRPRRNTSAVIGETADSTGNMPHQQDTEDSNEKFQGIETVTVEPLIEADLSDADYIGSDNGQAQSDDSSGDEDDDYSPSKRTHRLATKRPRGNEKVKTAKYVRKDREYTCKHCNQKFHLTKHLRQHLEDVHKEIFSSQCTFCGLDFEEKCRLFNQVGDEVPEYPYVCGLEGCKRAYKTVKEIRRHHQTKCVENPRNQQGSKFKCDQCEKSYVHLKALEYHISSIHEKSFKLCCEVCGMGFQLQSQLKNHMIAHSSEKPHECEMCKMRFRRKHQLFYHRRQHTGERPFVCEVCGKGFFVREKLKVHCESVHGERQHPCDICGKSFPSKHYLYNHVTITHYGRRKQKRNNKAEGEKKKVEGGLVEASAELGGHHTAPLICQEVVAQDQSYVSRNEFQVFQEQKVAESEPHAAFELPVPPVIL